MFILNVLYVVVESVEDKWSVQCEKCLRVVRFFFLFFSFGWVS